MIIAWYDAGERTRPSGNTYALGAADSTTIITFIIENGSVTGFEANEDGNKQTLKKVK